MHSFHTDAEFPEQALFRFLRSPKDERTRNEKKETNNNEKTNIKMKMDGERKKKGA